MTALLCAVLFSCEDSSQQSSEEPTRQTNSQESRQQADLQEPPILVYGRSELPDGQRDNAEAIGANLVLVDRDWRSRVITDDYRSYNPSISSDGDRIAFTRAQLSDTQFGPGYFGTSYIHVMDADGGSKSRLTPGSGDQAPVSSSDDTRSDQEPEFSPDGEKVAFLRSVIRNPEEEDEPVEYTDSIRVIEADGGESRRIASQVHSPSGLETGGYGPPTFSPDGRRVAFIDMTRDVAWAADLASGETERLFSAEELGLNSIGSDIEWSPEGDRLVIQGGKEPQGRYRTADVDAVGIVKPTGAAGPRYRDLPLGAGPTWTSDGEHVIVNRSEGLAALSSEPEGEAGLIPSAPEDTNANEYGFDWGPYSLDGVSQGAR